MDRHGHTVAVPVPTADMARRPLLDLSSGFMRRSIGVFHRQGARRPWTLGLNYLLDAPAVLLGNVRKHMAFDPEPAHAGTAVSASGSSEE